MAEEDRILGRDEQKKLVEALRITCVPQGGPISPLLSNLYLNEVDRMLERAKDVTRRGECTCVEYVRFADDVVVLLRPLPQQGWLLKAIQGRLREELAKLDVKVMRRRPAP